MPRRSSFSIRRGSCVYLRHMDMYKGCFKKKKIISHLFSWVMLSNEFKMTLNWDFSVTDHNLWSVAV